MSAELVFQIDIKLVALHIICPFSDMQVKIPEGFNRLKYQLGEIKNRTDHTRIIGCYPQSSDSPNENKCHYYLGVEVANHEAVPDQLVSMIIPSGQFVSYTYKGALPSYVDSAYTIVNSFIKEHGLNYNLSRHVLEVKNINNDLHDQVKVDNEITLMIPVYSILL